MNISILSPTGEIYQGKITLVQLPGTTGLFEVLANHAPMVAALGQGTGRIINTDGKKMAFTIEGGFVEVLKNEVSLLVRGYQAK